MARHPPPRKQAGVILIVTLVAMLVMTLLVSTMLRSSVVQMQIASNEKFSVQTFLNAEDILNDIKPKLDALGRGKPDKNGNPDPCPVRFFYAKDPAPPGLEGTYIDPAGCALVDPAQDLADSEAQCPGSTAKPPLMYGLTVRDCTIIKAKVDAGGKFTAIDSTISGDCSQIGPAGGVATVCGRTTLTLCTCTDQDFAKILDGIAQTYGHNPDGTPRVKIGWVQSSGPPSVVAGPALIAADGTLTFEQPTYQRITREYSIQVTVAGAIIDPNTHNLVSQARGAARTITMHYKVDF